MQKQDNSGKASNNVIKFVTPNPLIGDDSDDSAFEGPSSTVNHCHDSGDSGSRETRTEANPVAENSLLDAALRQLNAETTKH